MDLSAFIAPKTGSAIFREAYDLVSPHCIACDRSRPAAMFPKLVWDAKDEKVLLDQICTECHELRLSACREHPLYTKEVEAFFKALVSRGKATSAKRRLIWSLFPEEVMALYFLQGGRCALSGVKLSTSQGGDKRLQASVDRIDSDNHYRPQHIQIVSVAVNMAKQELSQEEFLELCLRVTTHSLESLAA